ncbi:MAG: tetratricopeptide repeat protein [Chloroflexota bacterium]|nr:tetratricopeptide repeat protein [Chloroflexota bacterium]
MAATRALLEEGARLVTLTGPGGTGKTRLGLQVAAELVETYRDGAWFVPLAPLTDPALVVSAMAGVLGVRETGHEPLETTLLEELAAKDLLLLLDNFEHLTGAAPLLGRIVAQCPKVRLLVTRRATLRVYGERELAVPPLALPDPKRLPPLEELGAVAAVELFVERAGVIRPDFALTEANAAAVAGICVRLEGLPLVIELAAARVRILPPAQLLERLSRRLDLLTGGAADRDPRQQTLRGAIAWSYDLLTKAEQTLFRRLGVFAGGTFETIEAVCGGDGAGDVLDGLESLVGKSLLRQEEHEEGPRFFLLETIREFALEQLEASGEAETIRQAHAEVFLGLAEEAEPALRGPVQVRWLERLEAEHDNLRAALGWSEELEDTETALRLAASLSYFWWVRGHVTEGRRWLERALERGRDGSPAARAKAMAEAGFLAQQQGDYAQACTLLDHSLALCRQGGNTLGAAYALNCLGSVAELRGEYELAELRYEESLAIYRELRDQRGINLGLNLLGALTFSQGNYDLATTYFKEQLTISRELRDTQMAAFALCNHAETLQHQRNVGRAVGLYGEALPLLEGLGDKRAAAEVSSCLGRLELSQGNAGRARELLCESLAVLQELGDKAAMSACLEALAGVATEQGAALEAARLFGAADALRGTIGVPLPPAYRLEYDRHLTTARTIEPAIFFAAAWEEGRALSLDQAVAEALGSSQSGS